MPLRMLLLCLGMLGCSFRFSPADPISCQRAPYKVVGGISSTCGPAAHVGDPGWIVDS